MRSADLTARARIRDAAITCFADKGIDGTTVRGIATSAEVSPGLVIHHFGSKDGLRDACDEYVVERIIATKREQIEQQFALDPLASLRTLEQGPPVLGYLARTLADGSPHVAGLIDRMVADAESVSRRAVDLGLMNPSDDEHARAVVLTLWTLGALVLHEQVSRLLGEDLLGDVRHATRYLNTATEVLGRPPLTEPLYERVRDALRKEG